MDSEWRSAVSSWFAKDKDSFQLLELELIINHSLGNTITVYGRFLPEDYELLIRDLCFSNNVTASV